MIHLLWLFLTALTAIGADLPREPIDVERFKPAITHDPFVVTEGTDVRWPADPLMLGVTVQGAWNPLVTVGDGDIVNRFVAHRAGVDLFGALTVTKGLALSVALPVFLLQDGDEDPASAGIGDVRLAPKWRIRDGRRGLGVAFIPEVHFASGQGNGSFVELGVTQACPGNNCEIVELHSADLDGDENPDIVASLDMGLSVIMGKGDGTFDNFELTLLPGADAVDSGDVNGDGNVDLLVANSQDGALRLLLGDGAGGLAEPMVFQTPATELRSAVIADLDQNGAPELLTTYTYNGGGWVGVFEANP